MVCLQQDFLHVGCFQYPMHSYILTCLGGHSLLQNYDILALSVVSLYYRLCNAVVVNAFVILAFTFLHTITQNQDFYSE